MGTCGGREVLVRVERNCRVFLTQGHTDLYFLCGAKEYLLPPLTSP